MKCPNLNLIELSDNRISDINVLEEISFPKLKYLYLSNNIISDISVFERAKLNNLELNLRGNKIDKDKYLSIIEKLYLSCELKI